MKLDEQLRSLKAKEAQQRDSDPVKEVKLLMEGDRSEDLRILTNLGLNSTLSRAQEQRGIQLELETLDKKYDGDIFTEDQIKEFCVKYRLRFLKSGLYRGDLDVELAAKVKEFAKNENAGSVLDNYSLKNNFFIMAPPEAFELKKEKFVKPVPLDPVLFFKTPENKYKMIHKWGKDFTLTRRLTGLKWQSEFNYFVFNFAIVLPVVAILTAFLLPTFLAEWPFWAYLTIPVVSFLANLIVCGRKIQWDTDEGRKRYYWTPENWNDNTLLL